MTSLFTLSVVRGIEVPEMDPRLISHVDILAVVSSDGGPAAPVTAPTAEQTPPQGASPSPAGT